MVTLHASRRAACTELADDDRDGGATASERAATGPWCGVDPLAPGASMGAVDDADAREAIEIVDELAFDAAPEAPFVAVPAAGVTASAAPDGLARCANPTPSSCVANAETTAASSEASASASAGEFGPPESRHEEPDPFAALTSAACRVASALGAAPEALQLLRALLGLERIEDGSPGEAALDALVAGRLVVRTARGVARTPAFHAQVVAWRAVLRGDAEDLSACGSSTLDEWAADVVARTVGRPDKAHLVRRELRAQGVAAFGLLAVAG